MTEDIPHDPEGTAPRTTTARISWAQLLKRVFNIDVKLCPHCDDSLKLIAAIQNPSAMAWILGRLGLPTRAPPRTPPRSFVHFATA